MHVAAALAVVLAAGCGPSVNGPQTDPGNSNNGDAGGSGGDGGTSCTPEPEDCYDNRDNDCDGAFDCGDTDCAATCAPVDAGDCGEATHGGDALAIPDGVGMSYETTMDIQGFEDGQTLEDISGFIGVCVTMEHSWLRDLQIEMLCPSGQTVVLQQFLGQTGGEIYMGEPNDSDGVNPIPGVGYEYCWTPTATNPPMLEWANQNPFAGTLPPGDYRASSGFDALVGCTLNGVWRFRATDDWGIDNGFVFEWSVEFNSDIISDCGGWDPIP